MRRTIINLSAIITLLFSVSQLKAQLVANYPFNQFSGSYTAITGGTVFGSTTSDDEYFVDPSLPLGGFITNGPGIPIGFNFSFNGNVYDRIGISNNGWISLGQSTLTPDPVDMDCSNSYNPMSSTSTAPAILQNKIIGLARDLQGQVGSELRVATIGSNPNQTLVVQFANYRKFASTGDNFNFQIRLSQTSNRVDFIYGSFTTTTTFNNSAEVGLRGVPLNDYNNRDVSTSNLWSTSIAGSSNTSLVNFSSTLTPVSGQDYQWSPPALCSGSPASGTAAISSATGCPNSNFTLTAGNLSSASGLTYQWQSAPASSGPWSNIIGANATTHTTTSSSVIFYQMVTTCTASSLSATTTIVSFTPSNCYTMSNQTITTCSSALYDSGGPNNDYQNSEDYTLTIVPSTPNNMISLNFVSFSTEQGFDYLHIYDGNSTSAPLIGTYDGNTLPPAITATNNTGIITLRFDSDGSVTDSGFQINISCYLPPTCAGTPSSGVASVSNPTSCLNVGTTLGATGITTGLGLTYQWQSAPSASGPWSNVTNANSPNYFVTATVTTFYRMITTCTISAQSATTSITSYTPSNCYAMSNSTITSCSGNLFDSGGQNGNYQNNEDYTLTIVPSAPSSSVMLSFITFSTEANFDYLHVFDGNSTSAPLIGSYDGNTLPPVITASNSAGVLTLQFESDGSVVYSGFEIAISCYTPCAGPPSAPTASSSNVCSGGQATLSASATGTAQWYTSSTATAYIATGNTFITPTLTSNVTYYVKDSAACGISSVTAITISVSPAQSLTAVASNTTICIGNSATLTASGVSSYTWSNASTQSVIVVTPTTNTTYTVNGFSALCNTSHSSAISLSVNPTPTVSLTAGASTICAGAGSISLVGSPSGGVYSGAAVNGTLLSIANAGTFTPMYSYTNSTTGCSNTATTTVIIANCTGLLEFNAEPVSVYPNPTNGLINLTSMGRSSKNIEITEITGKVIFSTQTFNETLQLSLNAYSNGVYYLKVVSDSNTVVFKVIKQ